MTNSSELVSRGSRKIHRRRRRVGIQDVYRLDIMDLKRAGILDLKHGQIGAVVPDNQWTPVIACVLIGTLAPDMVALFDWPPEGGDTAHGALLDASRAGAPGGTRWWFKCLHPVGNGVCLCRCRTLYRRNDDHFFGCRECIGISPRAVVDRSDIDRAREIIRSAQARHAKQEPWNNLSIEEKCELSRSAVNGFSRFVAQRLLKKSTGIEIKSQAAGDSD